MEVTVEVLETATVVTQMRKVTEPDVNPLPAAPGSPSELVTFSHCKLAVAEHFYQM